MKLSSREDIALPIEDVFAEMSDIEAFEARARQRGADLTRKDPASGPGLGSTWDARYTFRGKRRDVAAEVTTFDPCSALAVSSRSNGLDGRLDVELVQLSPERTRAIIGFELTPNTLSGRLLVQSLKIAKATLSKRFEAAVSAYARDIETKAASD